MKKVLMTGMGLSMVAVVLGELSRLPILTANGFLPNDLLVGLLGGLWLFHNLFVQRRFPQHALWWPFLAFTALSLVSLLHAGLSLPRGEWTGASLYWIRFVEYGLLIFLVADLANQKKRANRMESWLYAAAFALAILGFLQLKFFPDFEALEFDEIGWDPHQNRLLSTWFDPNFLGGLFAFVLSLIASRFLNETSLKKRALLTGVGLTVLAALFLTYSRSAYLAFLVPVFFLGVLKSKKILVGGLVAMLLLVSVSDRAYERVSDMVYSAQSLLVTDATELPDATARLRVQSWQNAWAIFSDHLWLGVGFNAYAYVQNDYGFAKSLDVHSASGSDATLLTVLATTGLLGFTAYSWFLIAIVRQLFRRRHEPLALGTLAGFSGLLIHSFFVNSLLFSPLLIFFYAAIGLSLPSPSQTPKNTV